MEIGEIFGAMRIIKRFTIILKLFFANHVDQIPLTT